jgi:formate/nitrite transporter FocA (FNT family)
METQASNWKTKILLAGAIAGAVIGLGTAYLMVRTAEENNTNGLPAISTKDALKVGVSIIGVARGIADLGRPR